MQHQLCCLDPPSNIVPSRDESLYNIVRLATLMYSDLVLFPLPDAVDIKPRLAYDLRKALELLLAETRLESQEEKDLVAWCITMGTIVSYETVHQEWYVERLAQTLREDQRLLDWILFQTLMSYFLWWDYVLQPRCWDVWNEAAQMLQADRSKSPSIEMRDTPASAQT